MKKKSFRFSMIITLLALFLAAIPICSVSSAAPIIIDHNSVAGFSSLSDAAIDAVQANISWHYAHTSHGGQLTTGLQRLEDGNAKYSIAIGNSSLPTESGALNIFNGQESDTYISPEEYWNSATGIGNTGNVLNHNPTINVSAWSWCTQLNTYSTDTVQGYLNQMAAFETAFPEVTFVYMTGNAQASGSGGLTRYTNNNLIRSWVAGSDNRVLFDFADLDAWWYDGSTWEQGTYDYNGQTIPIQHSHFNGSESGHTTYESCEQKGEAVWMMMAEIEQRNAVPIPGALWLLGSGFFGLVAIRRRRKKAA